MYDKDCKYMKPAEGHYESWAWSECRKQPATTPVTTCYHICQLSEGWPCPFAKKKDGEEGI